MNSLSQLNIKGRDVSSSNSQQANCIENNIAPENPDSRYKFSSFQSEISLELTEFSLYAKQD